MRLRDTALVWGAVVLGFSAVLYGVGALVDDPGTAFALLTGAASPAKTANPLLTYAVAADGFIVVPVAIAVAFAGLVDLATRGKQLESGGAEGASDVLLGFDKQAVPPPPAVPIDLAELQRLQDLVRALTVQFGEWSTALGEATAKPAPGGGGLDKNERATNHGESSA